MNLNDINTEIILMEQRLSQMEDKLNDVESKLDSMDKKLNQVIEALIGNPLSKNQGLSEQVKELGEQVEQHEESIKRVKWFWLGVTALGGGLIFVINLLWK